jgi:hypothetical protein
MTARQEARAAGRRAGREARKVGRGAKKGASSPWLENAARLGYIVRGVLYGVMGLLALGYAVGLVRHTADQRGSLYLLSGSPLKVALLLLVIIGLMGYGLWGFVRAIFDPLKRGDEPTGIAARVGFAWSGLSYLALLWFALQFVLGKSHGDGGDGVEKAVGSVMSHPFGTWLTIAIGLVAIAAGLGQFFDAYKAGFSKDLKRGAMNRVERITADSLGRMGMFARGVIFTMLGGFIVEAAIHHDPARAHGMGGAMVVLANQPMGHVLLAVVAVGFIALGLHSFACARWIRMLQPGH